MFQDAAPALRQDQEEDLERYNVIQDAHFSPGGASGATGQAGIADPIDTHVYLTRSEGSARQCLDLGERTCFLHAF